MLTSSLPHGRLFLLVLACSLVLALPPVIWPQIDLAVAGYFYQSTLAMHPAQWKWVQYVNAYLPDTFRAIGIGCLLGWIVLSLLRRLRAATPVLGFIGLAMLLGPGLSSWAMKEYTLRARPLEVLEFGGALQFTPAFEQAWQCTNNCAFFSGHVACGFFLVSLMLIDPRRRWWWLGGGLLAGALVSLARIAVGAHWISDALWALPITLICSALVRLLLGRIYARQPGP